MAFYADGPQSGDCIPMDDKQSAAIHRTVVRHCQTSRCGCEGIIATNEIFKRMVKMEKQDKDFLNECLILINAFKTHLSIINADYLSKHIIGVIRKGVVYKRDPDDRWCYKNFCADLDNTTKSLIGTDKQTGHFYVTSSNFRDYYLCDLIHSMRIETENLYQEEIDERRIKELEKQWKEEIMSKYQRSEHLRRLVWDLKPFKISLFGELQEKIIILVKEIIPNDIDFYSFVYCGLSFKCIESNRYNGNIHVAIKNAVGLFGNYVHYGRDKVIMQDQKVIEIPPTTYAPGLRHCTIVEISKGVFESLHDAEVIKIPQTINKLDWSFWHCRNLKSIEVHQDNKAYCSIDGVLYSKDHKVLYAYPNKHGSIYEVPEGVETVEKFAFKDCDNIKMITLPSTIKQIKLNAFYRATNLEKVICSCRKGNFIDEGFYGDYGDVNPRWFYIDERLYKDFP